MSGLGFWSYLAILLGASTLSLVLTPVALRFAVARGLLDQPGGHKRHVDPVPYLGGLAIVVSFVVAVIVAATLRPPVSGLDDLAVILLAGLGLAAVGLVDDLRGLPVWVRFAAQFVAAGAIVLTGTSVELFDLEAVNWAITILWIVGVTNAFNLLDNMDGLSAGVAALAAFFFFVIASVEDLFLVAALALALCGCSLGFLRHNFHPARIYMGDAGSLFLGFLLSYLGIKLRFDAPMQVTFAVPVLVVGVAIFDTALVTVTRLVRGVSPLRGGRDHTSHRLVAVGIPVRAAVSLVYGGGVALGWLALVLSRVDRVAGALLLGFVLTVALFLGGLLGSIPVHRESGLPRIVRGTVTPPRSRDDPAADDVEVHARDASATGGQRSPAT